MIVDDGEYVTLFIHEGVKAEKAFVFDDTLSNPDSVADKIVLKLLRSTIQQNPTQWTKMAFKVFGVYEEMFTTFTK